MKYMVSDENTAAGHLWLSFFPPTAVQLEGEDDRVQRENICSMERNGLGNEHQAGEEKSLAEELKSHPRA